MATRNPEDDSFDPTAADTDLGEVLDLDQARTRRRPDHPGGWSADIDDEHDDLGDDPVPVDPVEVIGRPTFVVSGAGTTAERRPIVPTWLRSKAEAAALVRWIVGHYTHVGLYHLSRTPLYAGRLAWRAPRGLVRTIGGTSRWVADAEGMPVRLAAVRREDAETYLKLSRQRDARVRLRTLVLAATLTLGASAVMVVLLATPRSAWYTILAAVVGLLGWIGSSPDKPLLDVAAVKPRVRKLTADVLLRAFLASGLCKVDDPITFPAPIMRDGPGWRAVIDLPFGVKADTAIKKRGPRPVGACHGDRRLRRASGAGDLRGRRMTKRRSKGDGALYWDETRQRFIAAVTVGYTPAGKRIVRRGSGKTKTEAKAKLREVIRDYEDGLAIATDGFTVADAVKDWLAYGLSGRAAATVEKYGHLCRVNIIPALGARKLRDLSATDVDKWLAAKAKHLSTRTLRELHACLNRAVNRAMARDRVKRNVVALCGIPAGKTGRPSKSLTLEQAKAVLRAAENSRLRAYVVVSLMTGARTEELRALTWDHVDLDGRPNDDPPVPPSIQVWRSVRAGGDTKTRKSRRTLALPARAVLALRWQRAALDRAKQAAGVRWRDHGLVFASSTGEELDAANVRRAFRRVAKLAGLSGHDWTPRELRHSFVSLLSDSGMSIEKIADLVGHSGTSVTEKVYRHQLRPVLLDGAQAMDQIFDDDTPEPDAAA